MANAIRSLDIHAHLASPAEADIRVLVTPARIGPQTEVRGRVVGPRCPGRSTIEVAYPLRPLPSQRQDAVAARVVIPDPSLFRPDSPFQYEGQIELWDEDQRCDSRSIVVRIGQEWSDV